MIESADEDVLREAKRVLRNAYATFHAEWDALRYEDDMLRALGVPSCDPRRMATNETTSRLSNLMDRATRARTELMGLMYAVDDHVAKQLPPTAERDRTCDD